MTKGKIQKIIRFIMPVFVLIAWIAVLDYHLIPTVSKSYLILGKSIEKGGYYNLVDDLNKIHRVDYPIYFDIELNDKITIEESFLFRHSKKIINKRSGFVSEVNFEYEFQLVIFISVMFVAWFVLKWLRETFFFLIFIPYIVMNFYFWVYLNSMKF